MNAKVAVVLMSGLLFACAPTPAPAPAPAAPLPAAAAPAPVMTEHHIVSIRNVRCDAVLKLAEDDRATASMFYIGYTASRRRLARIDVADLSGLEAAALSYCAAYPSLPAATAFNRAFADIGR
jgi:hypothetical protein